MRRSRSNSWSGTRATPVSQRLASYNVLTWIGVVGSAITLFANLSGVLDLADWARELVAHWHEWNQLIWEWMFGWLNIKMPKVVIPSLSFIVFVAILVIGLNLSTTMRKTAGHFAIKRKLSLTLNRRWYVHSALPFVLNALGLVLANLRSCRNT